MCKLHPAYVDASVWSSTPYALQDTYTYNEAVRHVVVPTLGGARSRLGLSPIT